MDENKKLLIAVTFNAENNTYSVDIPQGSSVNETAFAVTVAIKCLVRDGIIENSKYFTDLIDKYLNDPQYAEVKDKKKKKSKKGDK